MNNQNIFNILSYAPKLFIYLTTKCNLDCHHCYLGYRLKQALSFRQNDVINILDMFAQLSGKKNVTFLGGEPILYPEINTVLKQAKENGYYVRLDTNGSYKTDILQKIDLEYVNEVSISLDGASSEVHDKIRATGSFNAAIKNIIYLKKIGKKVRVITTVMKPNLSEIHKIVNLVERLDVDLLNLHVLSLNGNARNHTELWISPKEWLCLVLKIWESDLKIRFPLAYLPKNLIIETMKDLLRCECSELSRLSLFPDGRIYCCSLLFDTDLNAGIYDFNKKTIFISPSSEFYQIKSEKSCIAKDFMTQQDGFVNICRFKKIWNDDESYRDLMLKIMEIVECGEMT